jgi:hypothetical protein
LNFDVSQFEETLDAEARKTADLYLRALDRLVPPEASVTERVDDETPAARYARLQAGQLSDQDRAWLEANQPALQLALEANARPTCAFTTWLGQRPRAGISDLGRLLIMHGLAAEVDGQLEAALERYAQALRFVRHLRPMFPQMFEAQWIEREALGRVLGWAARPGQSAELLGRAQKLLEDHARQLPPFDEPIKWEYRSVARAWQQENDVEIHQGPIDALFSRIPWERERARRLLVLRTNEALELVDTVTRDVAQGASPAYLLDHRVQPTTNVQILVTPILHKAFTWFNGEYLAAGAAVEREADNRAARIILALLAAELTGGRLPSSLEELQGAELAEVPQDPFRGEPFDYFPRGFPIQVDPNVRLGSAASKRVTAGQPVLWSTGSRVRIAPNEVARPTFAVFDGRMWSAVNDLAAYAAGLTYAIPRAPAEPVHVQPPE